MERVSISLLRGVCQTPAYVAKDRGLFTQEGVDARVEIAPTAWVVPRRLSDGDIDFAVLPWTRVATAKAHDEDLVVLAGGGYEEAALVLRHGVELEDVRRVAVPQEGGMKDLTAAGLMRSLGLGPDDALRMPSGDGAILAFVGQAADAAVMVEPWATMLEHLDMGRVVRRTGDVWPGAPGCSLATSRRMLEQRPDLVRRFVRAYVRGAAHLDGHTTECAAIASRYIGVSAEIIAKAYKSNRPDVRALHNTEAMDGVLALMKDLGYVRSKPSGFAELGILDEILAGEPATEGAEA
jgi:ABC-type nitrate/sulfonate/bicarbonate transport system substrate-binding protein